MAQLTNFDYPIKKLTIISSPINIDGLNYLGLIHLKESWVEYPKYSHSHTVLMSQLAQQWISNIVKICDQCVQVYLYYNSTKKGGVFYT